MLGRVALVRSDVSKELSASFIRVTRIGELGKTQAATSNRRTLRSVRRFLQEPHGVTTQKTPFFIVTAMKTSNLTDRMFFFIHLLTSSRIHGVTSQNIEDLITPIGALS
jgi:hypothetical protein